MKINDFALRFFTTSPSKTGEERLYAYFFKDDELVAELAPIPSSEVEWEEYKHQPEDAYDDGKPGWFIAALKESCVNKLQVQDRHHLSLKLNKEGSDEWRGKVTVLARLSDGREIELLSSNELVFGESVHELRLSCSAHSLDQANPRPEPDVSFSVRLSRQELASFFKLLSSS